MLAERAMRAHLRYLTDLLETVEPAAGPLSSRPGGRMHPTRRIGACADPTEQR